MDTVCLRFVTAVSNSDWWGSKSESVSRDRDTDGQSRFPLCLAASGKLDLESTTCGELGLLLLTVEDRKRGEEGLVVL